ncbi:MAG: hypothetical protein K6D97_09115 [Clostridia bacterium]|nr:hypothetical protein [Clostridia bacterium]
MEQKTKKKSKIKIIKRIILLVLILYILSVVHKYFTFNKIHDETVKNISKDNYSMVIETKINDTIMKTTSFYRNGRGKSIASNGVFKWTNQKYFFVVDEKNKTISDVDMNDINEATGVATKTTFANFIPGFYKSPSELIKIIISPKTFVRIF